MSGLTISHGRNVRETNALEDPLDLYFHFDLRTLLHSQKKTAQLKRKRTNLPMPSQIGRGQKLQEYVLEVKKNEDK
jgi:hypothetical protein